MMIQRLDCSELRSDFSFFSPFPSLLSSIFSFLSSWIFSHLAFCSCVRILLILPFIALRFSFEGLLSPSPLLEAVSENKAFISFCWESFNPKSLVILFTSLSLLFSGDIFSIGSLSPFSFFSTCANVVNPTTKNATTINFFIFDFLMFI